MQIQHHGLKLPMAREERLNFLTRTKVLTVHPTGSLAAWAAHRELLLFPAMIQLCLVKSIMNLTQQKMQGTGLKSGIAPPDTSISRDGVSRTVKTLTFISSPLTCNLRLMPG